MNTPLKKTPEVAKLLNVSYGQIVAALRDGKLSPPQKDSSGDYVWSAEDMERARKAISIDRRLKANRAARKRVPA